MRRPGVPTGAALLALAALLTAAPAAGAVAAPPDAAGAVKLDVRVDKDHVAVGEPILVTVTATEPRPLRWEPRSVSEKAGVFDVETVFGPGPPPPDPNAPPAGGKAADPNVTQWIFKLTAFEIGKTEIPALTLRYAPEGGGESVAIETAPMKVEIVATVKDPEEKPADIRSGFGLPAELRGWLWLAAGLVAAIAAAILIRRWLKRRAARPAAPAAPEVPSRPAYDRYRELLEALLRAGHLEAGRVKEFHVELAEIVKRYLGEVAGIDAVDRTSWEVMQDLQTVKAPQAVRGETGAFLGACDLVKFAKHLPDRAAAGATVECARRILDLARPAPPVPPAAGGGAP
ncbi:MAG: hypothetical protein HY049_02520 [Acidobacteria bacterium]|nr:hypothetical protein [Acidobacteriota bacterium]